MHQTLTNFNYYNHISFVQPIAKLQVIGYTGQGILGENKLDIGSIFVVWGPKILKFRPSESKFDADVPNFTKFQYSVFPYRPPTTQKESIPQTSCPLLLSEITNWQEFFVDFTETQEIRDCTSVTRIIHTHVTMWCYWRQHTNIWRRSHVRRVIADTGLYCAHENLDAFLTMRAAQNK